ncbi:MAG TPA: sodium/solute symporter [Candidatus Hydrogenedentes bacterium]|nr:sodium/solute symporter [Candidatus Hydrogenedentota bacterium]HPA06382.1 sodium/solute symporter [Candidatus Hydrogenedentota bacterium]HPV38442.1 sodium/solute symporter [Candidatus Hydrogenedentota bacterium]HPX39512.1 sodium/solute symporter [Candidatus Hydrogenedentota bacterium]HQH69556.1 sodium/solute symporter [Candidatus Hydrogenedentota bacterium]
MSGLSNLDLFVIVGYFVVLVVLGFAVGKTEKRSSEDYFLAGRSLPWYVVGASFIGSNISTEHFIGMIAAAYTYGICVAQWEWGNIFAFSVLVWFFIPFLLSSRVFTAPEFLERRYNSACRLLFAVLTVVANITAFLAAVLYASAIGLKAVFAWPDTVAIAGMDVSTLALAVVGMGVVAGSYAIYGGLRSVAWTDVFQVVVMVIGGILVTVLGLRHLGNGEGLLAGWDTMIARNLGDGAAWKAAIDGAAQEIVGQDHYNRLQVFQPLSHKLVPWQGVVLSWLSVSIWYNCINQFMIQRVFAAKNDWHARMGILFAGFMKIFMPLIVVIPGLIYFAMEPGLTDAQQVDQTYAVLVARLLHTGMRGLLLAALFGAIQSTIDSVLNSTSTIITLDIHHKFINPAASEETLVKMGKWISAAVLVLAMAIAPFIGWLGQGVFYYIQNLYAYFAPPFAAVFLIGILWKRATPVAATITIPAGIAFGFFLEFVVFRYWLESGTAFTLRSVYNWGFCVVLLVFLSLVTPPPPPEKITDEVTINWRTLTAFKDLGSPWYRNVGLWYALFVAGILGCYAAFSGLFMAPRG